MLPKISVNTVNNISSARVLLIIYQVHEYCEKYKYSNSKITYTAREATVIGL